MAVYDNKYNQLKKPEKTILIITECRSGSNYLCALMSKTCKLGNPLEYFSPYVSFDRVSKFEDRCNVALDMGRSQNGIVAIKIFAYHLDVINEVKIHFNEIFQNRYWIWLRRHDLLEQAISSVIALQTKSWIITTERKEQPCYSQRMISRQLARLSKSEARWRIFFARNQILPLILWYEDFINSPENTIMKIAAYVDVDLHLSEINTDVYTQIQRTELNEEWKKKYISEMANINYLDEIQPWRPYPRTLKYLWKFIKGKLPSPD